MIEAKDEGTDWYRVFAYLLGPPSKERFSRLALPEFQEAVGGLWCGPGGAREPDHASMFESFEEYEACYIALFDVSVPEPPVPLLESCYKRTVPPQQTLLEITCFYDVINLKTDMSINSPDHLVTQLEFAASVRYLQENSGSDSQRQILCRLERDFLDRHLLAWIPAALARLRKLGPPVFPMLFELLLQFLHSRIDELGGPPSPPASQGDA